MSYKKSFFQGVPEKNVNKSRFNLSHEYKTQLLPGYLYPVLTLETLPGDEFDLDAEFMFRFAPLYFPIMHRMTMRSDWYWCPNRLAWPGHESDPGWTKWLSQMVEAEHPYMNADMSYDNTAFPQHVLGYMGIPIVNTDLVTDVTTTVDRLNAIPLNIYLKIWDEYERNPQLEDERWFPLEPGDNTVEFETAFNNGIGNIWNVLKSKWEQDYFTAALPQPQISDPVQIPMMKEWVNENGMIQPGPTRWREIDTEDPANDGTMKIATLGAAEGLTQEDNTNEFLYLDIQESAATIRELRFAEVLQSYRERIMKVGQRYRDFMKGLYGLDPQPMNVDVPILIGSKFGRVQIADVMTQAVTEIGETGMARTGDYTGQANMYSNDGGMMKHFCREHGYLMCILQVNANTSYGQGLERFWRRELQTDYPLDMFMGIGDQEILKEELYLPFKAADITAERGKETFGYIPQGSEMRFKNNMHVMNLNYTSGLQQHLGRWWDQQTTTAAAYDSEIEIDANFVNAGAGEGLVGGDLRLNDVFRILPAGNYTQYPTEGVIYAWIFHSIYVNRQLPFYSTPQLT